MNGFGSDPVPVRRRALDPERAVLRLVGVDPDVCFALERVRVTVGRADPPRVAVDVDLGPHDRRRPPSVSRCHAELRWVAGSLEVLDLGSRNGTRVNGTPVPVAVATGPVAGHKLAAGDRVAFGGVTLEVLADAPEGSAS